MGDCQGIDTVVLWWLLAWWAKCTNSPGVERPVVFSGHVIQQEGACLWKWLGHGVMNHIGSSRSSPSYPGVMAEARVCPLFLRCLLVLLCIEANLLFFMYIFQKSFFFGQISSKVKYIITNFPSTLNLKNIRKPKTNEIRFLRWQDVTMWHSFSLAL